MMFVVIALIGTGWAFIKPFLGEKDKNIFLVVIPLQILANIAIIVLEETAPGSQGWFTWVSSFSLLPPPSRHISFMLTHCTVQ
jgi:hypothetical protein